MLIVADENIPALDNTFGRFGSIRRLKGRDIRSSDLSDADVLLVRSVTIVNKQLLKDSPVKFVASATIGTDHLDTNFLEQAGILWCHAPGCNADAAAQYTFAMILLAADRLSLDLSRSSIGIVGLGNVGSRLYKLLQVLDPRRVMACDPPLADRGMPSLVSMKEICSCDIVSFHVPLTENGPYPTISLGNQDFFEALPHQALVVNASRGPVLEGTALHDWLGRKQGYAALDVWPGEPTIESSLIHKVTVATPHVAGYSIEGKLNGTRLIYLGFLDWLGIERPDPAPPIVAIAEKLPALSAQSVKAAVLAVCPVAEDDKNLRSKAVNHKSISGSDFDQLRKNYPARRDFSGWSLPDECSSPTAETLIKLGFS